MPSENDNDLEARAESEIDVFYDGDCPVYIRERGRLRKRHGRPPVRLVDVALPGFALGRDDYGQARLENGGAQGEARAFRQLYEVPERAGRRRGLPVLSSLLTLVHRWVGRRRWRRACRRIARAGAGGRKVD